VIVVDTSVAIAAALPGHPEHERALATLGDRTRLVAHVGLETYAVLTRLPQPRRVPPAIALAFIRERFELPSAEPPAGVQDALLALAPERGIVGGAIYDAVVGLTAQHAGATLVSLDRRAARTYHALGVDYRLVG
jgi:predicted nucleic acid-binding protein